MADPVSSTTEPWLGIDQIIIELCRRQDGTYGYDLAIWHGADTPSHQSFHASPQAALNAALKELVSNAP